MLNLTRKQREAVKRLYDRDNNGCASYKEFRKRAGPCIGCPGVVMIGWCNMFIGIEPDGYTHS